MLSEIAGPVAIGGVGGSGTRIIAAILLGHGVALGDDLNESKDNLWFTLLFKRRELYGADSDALEEPLSLLRRAMLRQGPASAAERAYIARICTRDRPQHAASWLARRAELLLDAMAQGSERSGFWGWKEPNTHVFAPQLASLCADLRYIHVMRHGLDMAFSPNQNQLRLWGERLLASSEVTPQNSLRFWLAANERLIRAMPRGRTLLVRFENLCADPGREIDRIAAFLGLDFSPSEKKAAMAGIRPPETIGRYRKHGTGEFADRDLARLRSLGYEP